MSRKMIDLILGKKTNPPSYEVLWRGIPDVANPPYQFSDHRPYMVKVKLNSH